MNSANEGGAEPGSSRADKELTPPVNHAAGKKSTRRKRRISKQLRVVANMPPLRHWPNKPRPFDIANSEVVQWAVPQAGVQQWLFGKFQEFGLIQFDRATGTWRGCAYSGEVPEQPPQVSTPANSQPEMVELLLQVTELLTAIHDLQNEQVHLLQTISVRMP
jgi:hypothetical protein